MLSPRRRLKQKIPGQLGEALKTAPIGTYGAVGIVVGGTGSLVSNIGKSGSLPSMSSSLGVAGSQSRLASSLGQTRSLASILRELGQVHR